MTHNATAPVDAEQSKFAAHAIKKRLDELNSPIKLNHAYEALAMAHRFPNWATMKASFKPFEAPSHKGGRKFVLGSPHLKENEFIERSIPEAIRHYHAFGSSELSRTKLLAGLSGNAIDNGSALIFCQSITAESNRNDAMMSIMDRAVSVGRRRDFFVLDASDLNSRLGNTFNILEYAESGEQVADLIFSLKKSGEVFGPHWEGYAVTSTAATLVLERSGRLTVDTLCKTLMDMGTGALTLSSEQIDACTMGDSRVVNPGLCREMATHVASVSRRNPRIFDAASQWSGIPDAFSKKEIVVVFLADNGDETEKLMAQIIVSAVKKAIRSAPRGPAFPSMAVFNDVTGVALDAAVVDESVAREIVIAVGDQCPTPPAAFNGMAEQFRCFEYENRYCSHYLGTDEGELRVYASSRPE